MKIWYHLSALERILFLFTFHMFSFSRYNIFSTLFVKRKCLKAASFHLSTCRIVTKTRNCHRKGKVFVGDVCSIFSVLHCNENLILSVVTFIILIRIENLRTYNLFLQPHFFDILSKEIKLRQETSTCFSA